MKRKDRRFDLISAVADSYERFMACAEAADTEEEIITFITLLNIRLIGISDKWLEWLEKEESEA